jgi:hypothetical protein
MLAGRLCGIRPTACLLLLPFLIRLIRCYGRMQGLAAVA